MCNQVLANESGEMGLISTKMLNIYKRAFVSSNHRAKGLSMSLQNTRQTVYDDDNTSAVFVYNIPQF